MVIRREQMDALGGYCARARISEMADRIRRDFPKELAGVSCDDFHYRVERLVEKMRGCGFSQLPYLYRLVCWGVFLGDDFLESFGDGSLIKVALSDAAERDRFGQIVSLMTSNRDEAASAQSPASR